MRFLEWILYGRLMERQDIGSTLADVSKMRYAGVLDTSYHNGFFGKRHVDTNHFQGRGSDVSQELYERIEQEGKSSVEVRKRRTGIIIELSRDGYRRDFTISLRNQTS